MWSLVTNTTPHGRTIMYMVTSATEESTSAVGHFSKIFDPGKNGLQLTDDSVTRLKNELAEHDPNVFFSYAPYSDDDTERPAEVCSPEMFFLQNMDESDKVIIIADTRQTQRWSEREIDPKLCKGDLAFFCNCPTTLESLRLWAHERNPGIPRMDLETIEFADVLGAIADLQHLTRCAQVCFAGTEEVQAQQRDQERLTKVQRRIKLNSAIKECCKDISMSGLRQHKAKTSNTQSITTPTLRIQSRSGSRCVRDHRLSRRTLFDHKFCLYGNHLRSAWIVRESESLGAPSSHACHQCLRSSSELV